jgi:nucleoside-diphosphate-sugar epimerase
VLTGDVRDVRLVQEALRGVTVAYHCAAAIGHAPKLLPRDVHDINLAAARSLLEAARQAGTGRVVLLSSVNVLGSRHLGGATEELPCRRSGDPAADVKIAIENLAWEYHRRHGLGVTVVRPGLIYGPRDRVTLPRFVSALCDGRFRFVGSRDHVVPIVHVEDVAWALVLAGSAPGAAGRAYHITDGSGTTIGEFIDYLAHLLGCPRPTTVLPDALGYAACLFCEAVVKSGLGRFLDRAALYRAPPPITRNVLTFLGTSRSFDIRRARDELGYAPHVGYREGLADAVRWLREPTSRLTPIPRPAERSLRARAEEAICRHWVAAAPREPIGPLSPAETEERSRAALDALLTRQFRVGRLPDADVYEQLLGRVRRRVRKGQPIAVTVGFGPLKNPAAVAHSRADWAEFFALCHLVAWHNKVQRVYPPGLRLQIVFDNATLARANDADPRRMDAYMSSVADLILALGFDAVLPHPAMQSSFTWPFHLGLYQLADWRVRRWERDPANQDQVERMIEFARRNVVLPAGLGPGDRARYLHQSSHRFRICWEAMRLSGLPRSKNRLLAVYLDGTQHHFHGASLHLTSLDKGQVTQPWQGEGALLDNGHGRLEPFVLTAGRRVLYQTRAVEGLDLIGLPGFERIQVAAPRPGRPVEAPAEAAGAAEISP